jgi:Rrf2 family protein
MFSQTLEYALRVVVYLASAKDEMVTTREIAQTTRVPESYLAKVIQDLRRGGLVRAQRGLHGGSSLARPPESITLFDVAQAIDPLPRITTCPLGLKSHGTRLCAVHQRLDDAMGHVERVFRNSTVAELIAERRESRPLCETPEAAAASTKSDPAPIPLTVRKRKNVVR